MSEQRIEVGQRWVPRDRRDPAVATVIECPPNVNEPGHNDFVTVQRFRKSTLRAHTLRTRYRLTTTKGAGA